MGTIECSRSQSGSVFSVMLKGLSLVPEVARRKQYEQLQYCNGCLGSLGVYHYLQSAAEVRRIVTAASEAKRRNSDSGTYVVEGITRCRQTCVGGLLLCWRWLPAGRAKGLCINCSSR